MSSSGSENGVTMRRTLLLASILFVLAILQGCFVAQKSLFCSPSLDENTAAKKNDNLIFIEMAPVNLTVTASYRPVIKELMGILILPPFIPTKWKDEPNPDLIPDKTAIEVRLDPAGKQISFDPLKATLRTADGRELKPAGFVGPTFGSLYISGGMRDPTRSRPRPCSLGDGKIKTSEGAIVLDETSCFWVLFDRKPYPDMDFDLSLNGVSDAGKPVSIPVVHFKKDSAWMFGIFP
jgi:hypothetical protein